MQSCDELSLEGRRQLQANYGLLFNENSELRDIREVVTMAPTANVPHVEVSKLHACSPAQTALNRMAQAMTQPPTWKQVAAHECKRALVYVPILVISGLLKMWMQRKMSDL